MKSPYVKVSADLSSEAFSVGGRVLSAVDTAPCVDSGVSLRRCSLTEFRRVAPLFAVCAEDSASYFAAFANARRVVSREPARKRGHGNPELGSIKSFMTKNMSRESDI